MKVKIEIEATPQLATIKYDVDGRKFTREWKRAQNCGFIGGKMDIYKEVGDDLPDLADALFDIDGAAVDVLRAVESA